MIFKLEQSLRNNPTARPGDRAVAENIIKDLCDALREQIEIHNRKKMRRDNERNFPKIYSLLGRI